VAGAWYDVSIARCVQLRRRRLCEPNDARLVLVLGTAGSSANAKKPLLAADVAAHKCDVSERTRCNTARQSMLWKLWV
jgi:hypothetical protein